MRLKALLVASLLMPGTVAMASEHSFDSYVLDLSDGLSITHTPSGVSFLKQGRFHADVVTMDSKDDSFILSFINGDSLTIEEREGSGFLELKWRFQAPKDAARTLTNTEMLTFAPDGISKTPTFLGTGGVEPDEGSYMFMAVADPSTRRGMVAAWLTSEWGSGVVLPVPEESPRLAARVDYGKRELKAGASEPTDSLLIGFFDDARLGLEAYADEIAKHHDIELPPQPGVYCTWYHARASNAEQFAENAEFIERELKPYGLDVMQIDDGWQLGEKGNGPKKNFTAHNPEGPYPDGMKPTADDVDDRGMTPGIWWMPFAGTDIDPHYGDKMDFFVKDADGKPWSVRWGGTCLDMTNPEALDYVKENSRRIARKWDYGYYKLDGLWTGIAPSILYVNDAFKEDDYGEQQRFDPSIPPVMAFRMGMEAVRKGAGKDVFILGCNISQNMRTMGASYGLFDAMRVGPDNNAKDWSKLVRGVFNSANRYFLHGRVWYNDPDPHYVRTVTPMNQARTLSSWVGVTGLLNTTSEDYGSLPPERLDLFRRTLPAHGLECRPLDYFEQTTARVWIVTDERAEPARHAIGFFNWNTSEKENSGAHEIDRSLSDCDLDDDKTYVGYDYWNDTFIHEVKDRITMTLPFNECRVWSLRENVGRPMVVSTSRHVTQGVVDLSDEEWNAKKRALTGTSQVVGGDDYEIRIISPKRMKATSVEASGGAKISLVETSDERETRVLITSGKSQAVKWRIAF